MDIENEGSPLNPNNANSDKPKKKLPLLPQKVLTKKNSNESPPLFEDHVFVFIPFGSQLTKKRVEILKAQCLKCRAEVIDFDIFFWQMPTDKQIFIITTREMGWDYLEKVVHVNYLYRVPYFVYIDCEWITKCLQSQKYLDPTPYSSIHPSQMAQLASREPSETGSQKGNEIDEDNEEEKMISENNIMIDESELETPQSDSPSDFGSCKPVSEQSMKTYELMKNSRELFDYCYGDNDSNSNAMLAEPMKKEITVKHEPSILVLKEEDMNNWRLNYYDEDVIFLEPKREYNYPSAINHPNSKIKSEAQSKQEYIKNEAQTKNEINWDPTFFGDEDVHVSNVKEVKKEFLTEKDLEGTIIEGIEDFQRVNKNEEGDVVEVRGLKLLHPGQRRRDSYWDSKKETFACQIGQNRENPNAFIISELENVLKMYTNVGDQGRMLGYRKAITSIRGFPRKIETEKDLDEVPSIGEKIRKKIVEILQTGALRKARILENDEQHKALNLFMNIWGVGLSTAQKFYMMGFRTLDDLRKHPEVLNEHQALGLKYYEDLQQRIPRAEVEQIINKVQQRVDELSERKGTYEMIACGSYRRGKPSSGDIDLLITRKDGKPWGDFLYKLVKSLEDELITDHITLPNMGSHGSETYMGWVMLKEVGIHRRLDIKIYPREHFAFAVLYFTGSQNFNRSMRLFARKKGYSLGDYGLLPANRIKNESVWKGKTVPCYTEEDIFRALGLEYKKPEDRDLG